MEAHEHVEPPSSEIWARGARATVIALCGVVPALGVGMDMVRSLADGFEPVSETLTATLVLLVFFTAPAALYVAVIHRPVPAVIFGAGLVVIEYGSYWSYTTGTSSTAALALLNVPLLGMPWVLLGWLVHYLSRPE